jgi:hypothetical protein
LVNLLLKKVKENNCDIRLNSDVKKIIPLSQPFPQREKGVEQNVVFSVPGGEIERGIYEIELENKIKYKTKNIIIST